MELKISKRQYNSKNCFICGLDNEMGLKTRFYETEDQELIAVCTPKPEHQSYPNRLHGGVSAAILDETIGRAICARYGDMVWGVTMELNLKYRKPLPYGVELEAIGRITEDRGRLFRGTGEIYLPDGEVAVTAEGLYMKRRIDQIADEDFVGNEWGFAANEEIPATIDL